MKITIDTKEDSPEEIRKAVELLTRLIGEKPEGKTRNIFEDDSEKTEGSVFGTVFGDSQEGSDKESKDESEKIELVEY